MKRYLSIYIFLLFSALMFSQSVQISAPTNVSAGENFRVEYHVSSDDVSDVRFSGRLPEGLEEIAGPYVSTQSSYQIINGHTSSNSSARITYLLYAAKAGNYTIPSVTIRVNDKTITSRTHHVRVSGTANQSQQSAPRMHQQPSDEDNVAASSSSSDSRSVFIKVTANKNTVVEQEPIKITYKLYTATQITVPSDLKMPNVQDFTIYEIPQPQTAKWGTENIGGKMYKCVVWKQYIVYPQGTGKLTVPGSSVQINRVVRNHNIDPIEQMFNPGSTYHEEEMLITVPSLTLNVTPLPERPKNFSGGVGNFSMSATLSRDEIKAGEPISVKVRISGVGNMKLIKQPTVKFPSDFEIYDPKVSDHTQNTNSGIEGTMTYEYIAVPQNKGKYTIPPIEFTYYDSNKNGYKTIKSQAMALNVLENDKHNSSAESYQEELKNSDIHTIKQLKETDYRTKDRFFLSTVYVICLITLLAVFFVLLYVFRKRAIERADIVRMKANRANKVATRKLKKAALLMHLHKKDEFYDEVLRALWGYAADKINIPVENLSKDNIQEKLASKGCNTYSVEKFTDAIAECEFVRYAPSQDEKSGMRNTYEMAVTAITEIEESLKLSSHNKPAANIDNAVKTLALLFVLMLFGTQTSKVCAATTIETANAAYLSGNYQQAITLYEQAIKAGDSPELYYNLGNACYRTNQITKALFYYEKAYIFNPCDDDIRHNLNFVRTKTVDKQIPSSEVFFVHWYKSIIYSMTIYGWALFSICMIILSLVSLLCYLFADNSTIRKTGFWLTLISFLFFLLSVVFALHQSYIINNNTSGLITAKVVTLREAPENSSPSVIEIHEGTHIDVIDDAMTEWKEVELPNGQTGWIKAESFVRIK
ncbi:MAG: BatD family protein [Bacteroidaceae bacterium]|nr:BatD family protein [Bacteroidaceae bacterium]